MRHRAPATDRPTTLPGRALASIVAKWAVARGATQRSVAPSPRYRYTRWRWRLVFGVLDGLAGPPVRWLRWLKRHTRASTYARGTDGSCASRSPAPTEPKAILVAQLDHLGDAVLSTVIFPLLRRRFPDAAIDVLASGWNEAIFRSNPYVRHVHVSRRNWFSREASARTYLSEALQLGRQMARHGYDLGIDVRGDFLVALLLRVAGIPRRVGWSGGGGEFLLSEAAPWLPGRPEIEARRVLLQTLGIATPALLQPVVYATQRDRQHVRRLLATVAGRRWRVVVIHSGAGTDAKRWPTAYWQQLVDRLVTVYRPAVIVVGTGEDRLRAAQIVAAAERGAVLNWAGRLSVLELAALLELSDLFVGNDSGPAHIAAAVGTTTLVLFSGTNEMQQWRPPGEHVHVLRHPVACAPCHQKSCPVFGHPCMTQLTPDRVWTAVDQLLGRVSSSAIEVPAHACHL